MASTNQKICLCLARPAAEAKQGWANPWRLGNPTVFYISTSGSMVIKPGNGGQNLGERINKSSNWCFIRLKRLRLWIVKKKTLVICCNGLVIIWDTTLFAKGKPLKHYCTMKQSLSSHGTCQTLKRYFWPQVWHAILDPDKRGKKERHQTKKSAVVPAWCFPSPIQLTWLTVRES